MSFEKLGAVGLKVKLRALSVALFTLIAMLGVLASLRATSNAQLSASTSTGSSQAVDEAEVAFRRALTAVRDAEAAGADASRIAASVERLNSVVEMIDEAKRLLLQGDVEEADALAQQTIGISEQIVSNAVELRNEASVRTYYGKILTFGMAPVASLLVTIAAHYGWKWWCKHEVDRIMRMEIKKVKEPEEEK